MAAVSATWPAIQHGGHSFLAGGAAGYGEAAPGDHLQTAYDLWLPGHQLEHGHAPWLDPYSFQPESSPHVNFQAWPFAIPYWPLAAALGPVQAWNAFLLLTYLGAGLLACWWLRELDLPRGAALVGGLAFALAPYRVAQSAGHLLGPISLLLPLALVAFERARRGSAWWLLLSGAALTSIPLSGQVHLALGAIPFFCLYVAARVRVRGTRLILGAAAGVLAATLAGLLVRQVSIVGSIGAGGRSLASVSFYSAQGLDFVTRHARHGAESFVFLGWLLPVLAVAGLVVLALDRRFGLLAVLGVGAVVPILLALGTHFPLYTDLWHHFPPFRYPRVPERLLPIACLSLAALTAFAIARLRWRIVTPLAVLLLFVDLHVHVYRGSPADGSNAAYAALRTQPPGRLLELPVFLPELDYGSVYEYYDMLAPRERPGGYSTLAPVSADRLARTLGRLNCGDWTGGVKQELERLDVRYITFHRGLFGKGRTEPDSAWFAWHGLEENGFQPVATGGAVTLFEAERAKRPAPLAPLLAPRKPPPYYCAGWYPAARPHARIRTMSATHAPLWVNGGGTLIVLASAAAPLVADFAVDGKVLVRRKVAEVQFVSLPLKGLGWHLITIDVPQLLRVEGRQIGLDVVLIHRHVKIVP